MARIALIDGNSQLHRVLHIQQYVDMQEGSISTGGIYGFLRGIRPTLERFDIERCFVAWDCGHSTRRKEIHPKYKAREPDPTYAETYMPLFLDQHRRLLLVLEKMGVHNIKVPGREADDIIGHLAILKPDADELFLVSEDFDFCQLIRPGVSLYRPRYDKLFDNDNFVAEFGYSPNQFVLARSISGDNSDNINGVYGVGHTTIRRILELMETDSIHELEMVAASLNDTRASLVAENIELINRNISLIDLTLEEFTVDELNVLDFVYEQRSDFDYELALSFLNKYGLLSLIKSFDTWSMPFQRLY